MRFEHDWRKPAMSDHAYTCEHCWLVLPEDATGDETECPTLLRAEVDRLRALGAIAAEFCERKQMGTLREWIDTYDDQDAMDALSRLVDAVEGV